MKNKIITKLMVTGLILTSLSTFAVGQKGINYDILFAKSQSIIEKLDSMGDLKNLPPEEKDYFTAMYVIELKSGEIVYSPEKEPGIAAISAKEALEIVNKTVKAWQYDESKTVYDIGDYIASVVVTNSRDVYVLVVPNVYNNISFQKPY